MKEGGGLELRHSSAVGMRSDSVPACLLPPSLPASLTQTLSGHYLFTDPLSHLSLSLCVCLSLLHTFTHTHAHIHTHTCGHAHTYMHTAAVAWPIRCEGGGGWMLRRVRITVMKVAMIRRFWYQCFYSRTVVLEEIS